MHWNRGSGGGGGAGQARLTARARPHRSAVEILRRVAEVFWPYHVGVLALLVTVTLSALVGLAPPLLFASIIDNIRGTQDVDLVNRDAALILGAVLVAALLSVSQSYLNNRVGQ